MGQLDQFAKQIFAEETAQVTGGAAIWQPPPELNLSEVRLDGVLVVRDRARLLALPPPWSEAGEGADEIVLEIKMAGDHVDTPAVQRTLLRRQARQVQRCEDPDAPFDGEVPLWMVAPHLPRGLAEKRTLDRVAPGCWRVGPSPFPFLWIAANDLPLRDELIPFLLVRSGRALDELVRWVEDRRPPSWLERVVEFLPMSVEAMEHLAQWITTKSDDPAANRRKAFLAQAIVKRMLGLEVLALFEGERRMLRRALAHRGLVPTSEESARIDTCADVDTFDRWHDQAMDAASVAEALR